ncbi:hypothetical protein 7F23_15 [uncultured Caudovirales phage]|uniref:SGNH hydrolase-type esterase domain-containing protein n=1 Tax=uncultured Caudovirales phage TaxID=2100421 RepID=A0A2H4J9Z4_9CAUD|nr:hypothetical protein 7F23_15 [uncultured Caudovirales phage]
MASLRQINFKLTEDLFKIKNHFNKTGIVISTLGSSVTKGAGATSFNKTWSFLLYKEMNEKGIPCRLFNNGYGGFTTSLIIKEKKYQILLKQRPDIILFEMCLINNHSQSVPLNKTFEDLDFIADFCKNYFPKSKLIFIVSNPSTSRSNLVRNGLTYNEYVRQICMMMQETHYQFINFWDPFFSILDELNNSLSDCLYDGIHPNDLGYKLWFDVMKDELLDYCLS